MLPSRDLPTPSEEKHTPLEELLAGLAQFQLTDSVKLGRVRGLGGNADVYDGTMTSPTTETKRVAVKKFRVMVTEEETFVKVLCTR
jgi:hypothetical protein